MKDPKLKTEDIDKLGQAILSLTEELWVVKDRQRILEDLLDKAGIVPGATLDQHQPDAKLARQLASDRQQLVNNVIGALRGPRD